MCREFAYEKVFRQIFRMASSFAFAFGGLNRCNGGCRASELHSEYMFLSCISILSFFIFPPLSFSTQKEKADTGSLNNKNRHYGIVAKKKGKK